MRELKFLELLSGFSHIVLAQDIARSIYKHKCSHVSKQNDQFKSLVGPGSTEDEISWCRSKQLQDDTDANIKPAVYCN